MAFTHIDCFSGPGGICTGMHAAGFDTKVAIEYIKSTQMYEKYNPNFQIERLKNLKYIIEMLNDEEAEWFKNQLKYEIDAKRESILDYKKCRYKAEKQEVYKEYLDRMIV